MTYSTGSVEGGKEKVRQENKVTEKEKTNRENKGIR
jgi:hypothetical protein